ncbi:hypothetical protein M413DRAFT_443652 [Hebeloma cylindrosporum]|uniref:Uncharacterized protein n=1 Tax=Hebeloma cylindrosporum TaxID=76867 RepID=A0A0C3CJ52_HEBCY|nr:hypothetical protein M413DRAFT_443652 [Hebeloma cylindrosporum h7]
MKVPWHNIFHPPPAPPGFGTGKVLPERSSSWLSRLGLHWIGAFLNVGFTRPLEKEDFWELPPSRHTGVLTDAVEQYYYERCPPEKRPFFMRDTASPSVPLQNDEKQEAIEDPVIPATAPTYDESLLQAIHQTFKRRIWASGLLLLVSDTLRTTAPLLNKVLITWLVESYAYFRLSESDRVAAAATGFTKPRGPGYGIGLAFAVFVMQQSASLMGNHFMLAGMTTGLYIRTSIIGNIFRKSLRLSGRARAEHSIGHITTLISKDATHLDAMSAYGHHLWSAPIQLIIGIGLLIGTLGYSALVGLAVIVLSMPLQFILITIMFTQSKKGVKITDKRVRLTTEVLQGIRLIKAYGWEAFYTRQITALRGQEIRRIRKSSVAASWMVSMFSFMPVLASVLSFITYSLTGHDLNIAVIFTSLQLFNIIRVPLLIFPLVLNALAQAMISIGRICKFLTAEELEEPYRIDPELKSAFKLEGDFEWETVVRLEETSENLDEKAIMQKELERQKAEKKAAKEKKKAEKAKSERSSGWWKRQEKGGTEKEVLPSTVFDETPQEPLVVEEEPPFSLKDLKLEVPRGAFVAIVGRVGSGKSSVLQALIGEMRRTKGEVVFGGSVAYVPQVPWVKNATLRENVLFGEKDDEARFREVVHACGLEHDLNILPNGENTQIGEKGITLSGGQKARVSLARASYSHSDIVLLDDPLSAVDAFVGKSILDNCLLQGPLADRTRVLVTHALHFLDQTDYIYVMDHGKIIEQGTYQELMTDGAVFSRLIEEHGNSHTKDQSAPTGKQMTSLGGWKAATDAAEDVLMQEEERNTGAVSWDVYQKYLKNAGGILWAPVIGALLLIVEGNNVATTLFLGFWSGNTISHFSAGEYMAAYAGLGVALALSTFTLTYAFVISGLYASLSLYKGALRGVLSSRISFFDTTPMGRVVSRLSKDMDIIDTQLPLILMQFLTTFTSVVGTVALVFYTFPYLGIIFLPLGVLYYVASVYYRRSSVETKRLDSLLRSFLYGSYSETLTGLSTIRAYRHQKRSIDDAEHGLDMENRAYIMTVAMQRWLAIRLELFANLLILGIALFGVGFRYTVSPAKFGVVLSYTLLATQTFSEMINLFAQSEQNMNAVERVLHYAELPSEEKDQSPNGAASTWPDNGSIVFENVNLVYREGLPLVLKGVSFRINPGEKVGIVGRTGSGKSSLIQALLRMVELQDGKIQIDNVDISTISLNVLRTRIGFVPQDTTLFLGNLRDNLDPQSLRTDAELISILQRAWLLPKDGPVDPAVEAKFSLDSVVGDEGSNFSAGEKQLLALCRALVKNSRLIVLDEATSSVDPETDAKIQQTIQDEFAASTLLCIAHRLNTIAHYDRILVMDNGRVAEFDTVLNLFDRPDSIFRSLCDEAHLQRSDILKLRHDHGVD